MDIDTIEKDDRLILDMRQNHTIANLVRKAIWESDGEAGYDKGHPLGEQSNLVVKSDQPKETIQEGIETAREWLDELEDEF